MAEAAQDAVSATPAGPGSPAPALRSVVTGAANGIGAAVAAALRARGDDVIGIDKEQGSAILEADLSDPRQRQSVMGAAIEQLGGIDVLINVAATARPGSVLDSTPADWAPVWAVNLEAPLDLIRHAAPHMVGQRFGRIVNVTSIQARMGEPRNLAYAVAKAGLEAGTRSAAIDLGRDGVLVNAVAPGFVRTRMSVLPDGTDETQTPEFMSVYVDGGRIPIGRAADAEEMGPAVLFLTSRANTYVTGSVLTVDGGLTVTF